MKNTKHNSNNLNGIKQEKSIFTKFLPHILAIVAFIAVGCIYFSAVLGGKVLPQSDMTNYFCMSKELRDYTKTSGERSSWTNSMFSGMPSYQINAPNGNNLLKGIGNTLTFGDSHTEPGEWSDTIGILFILMLGFYVFMSAMGAKPLLSFIAAVIYALGSYNIIIINVGHITKAWSMAMMAPIFAGMILCFKKKYGAGFAIFALSLGLQIFFNHIQITYYTMLVGIVIGLTYLVVAFKAKAIKPFLKAVGILLIGCVLAVLPSAFHLMSNQEYVSHTMRGGSEISVSPKGNAAMQKSNDKGLNIDYAFQWSYGLGETMTLLIPDARGGGGADSRWEQNAENRIQTAQTTQPNINNEQTNRVMNEYIGSSYWGEQSFTAGPVYFGAIIIFLSLLGFMLLKGPERWWLLIATIMSVFIAWGSNFMVLNKFLFDYLPLYNKFRTPSMILVVANVTLVITAFFGLRAFFASDTDIQKRNKYLYISAAIVGGISLLCALLPDLFGSFSRSTDVAFEQSLGSRFIEALQEDRKAMFRADAFRSFIFIAIAFAALWLYTARKVKKEIVVVAIIGIAAIIDLWGVDKRYLNADNFKKPYEIEITPTQGMQDILEIEQTNPSLHFRVFNLAADPFTDARTSYFFPSVGGYHGAKLQRYQDIINFYLANPNYIQKDLNDTLLLANNVIRQFYHQYKGQIAANIGILNMLDAKYVILPVANGGKAFINPEACGAAWFVPTITWAKDANEEILKLDNFNPKQTAIVDKRFQSMAHQPENIDTAATITIEPSPNNNPELKIYKTSSKTEQLAVFSEIYYKEGWKAFIDGKEVPYFRANYILRAMNVPSGNHTIEFRFEPPTLRTYSIVGLIGSLLLLLSCVGALISPFCRRKSRKN
ncbi:MAG: YfhO family protein [Bacteroidales bacterium]|jgi:hypothetical protein|nr:YfhO family protein [Bacteroidales bacterium]